MVVRLDIAGHDAPFQLAKSLTEAPEGEKIELELPDVEVCANRIVPVVGIADAWLSKGRAVSFKTPPHSAVEKAVAGFGTPALNAVGQSSSPFGRVWRFDDAREQAELVNAMTLELDKTANLAAGVKQGFEWCFNEVTDNVLNHSRPGGGAHGYVMVQYLAGSRRLKVCVFDTGIGLRESFAGSRYAPATAEEAIRLAVGKGVTNGNGQGNGLWGLHEMVKASRHGKLHIRSGDAEYLFDSSRSLESVRPSWALPGFPGTTTVDLQMDCSEATSLQSFFGPDYVYVDLWQEAREREDGSLLLLVRELADGYGSRESGRKVRHVVENAIDNDHKFVELDFSGVSGCSSSFIDELIAKLIAKYGVVSSQKSFRILNLAGLDLGLANMSTLQRLRER